MFARDIQHSERIRKARRNLEQAQSTLRDAEEHAAMQPPAGQFNAVDEAAAAQATHLSSRSKPEGQRTLTDC
jgi:hypothetical protein